MSYQTRIVARQRPLGLFHFLNPRHWTPKQAHIALEQGGQALFDEAIMVGFRVARTRRSTRRLQQIIDEAQAALQVYDKAGWLDEPELAYPAQAAPSPDEVTIHEESLRGLKYEHIEFPSGYQPHPDDPSSSRWLGLPANNQAHAWVLRHPEPRPWVVGVHGAEMGRPIVDFMLFRARWMHEKLGLNVALPILPLHGPRAGGGHFPSEVVAHNVHGVLQAVADVRRTMAWIRQEQPGAEIGIHGISLGGHVTAIVASLEEDLACAIVGVAPMDLVLLLERHHGTGHGRDLRVQNFDLGAQLGQMTTPLRMQPKLPRERRYFYAGVVDRLVDFSEHQAPMIAHWDYPTTLVYNGGHVGIGMSKELPPFVARALGESGLLEPRDARATSSAARLG
jgi:hypothetical protein